MKSSFKLLFLTIIMILFSTGLYASGIGIRGGFNFSSLPSSEEISIGGAGLENSTMEALSDSYTGYHFGAVGYFSILGFFVQPEFLFSKTGQEMAINVRNGFPDPDDVRREFFTQEFSHLTIPLIAGLSFGPFRFGIGPVASYMIDSTSGYVDMDEDMQFGYNDWTVGYQALAGIKIGSILLDLKYEGNLSNFGESVSVGGNEFEFDTRPRQFIVSIGLLVL